MTHSRLRSILFSSPSIHPISYPSPLQSITHTLKTHLSHTPRSPFSSVTANFEFHEPANQLFDGMPNRIMTHQNSLTHLQPKRQRDDNPLVSYIIRTITSMVPDHVKHGIHAGAIKTGFESEIPIATVLIGYYSSLGDLGSARQLFYATPVKDLILWSAMVSACCKNGQFSLAIDIFSEMLCFSISLNYVSLLGVLTACANTGDLRYGRRIHGMSVRRGFDTETILQNSLVDMYAKCGNLDDAVLVFNGIEEKDLISWKNMIFGCASNGHPREAVTLFSGMRNSDIEPDEMTVRNVISICPQVGDLATGHQFHCFAIKKGLLDCPSVGSALARLYAELKEVGSARTLFGQLRHKDFIAWNGMVSAYSHSGCPVLAIKMFREMRLAKEEANEMTLVSLLQACSMMEAQRHGRSIHAYVMRFGYMSNMHLASALIDFYCRIGRVKQAEDLFDQIQFRDLVCWSSMIKGYGTNGCGSEAIHAFSNMLEQGLLPNGIVLVSLLSACSHCGMVDEGWKWFNSMEERFGVRPTPEHYTCIIDMLGRQGLVEEALEFVKSMPVEPDVSIWSALLSWCKTAPGSTQVSEIAVQELSKLDPDKTSYYVTLSNIYSQHGRWDDAERARVLIEKKGLKKIAGYSMV